MKTKRVEIDAPDFEGYRPDGIRLPIPGSGDHVLACGGEILVEFTEGTLRTHGSLELVYRPILAPKLEIVCPHEDCGWSGKAEQTSKRWIFGEGDVATCPQCGRRVDFPDKREK